MTPLKPWMVWIMVGWALIMISAITVGTTVKHGWRRGAFMAGLTTLGAGVPVALMIIFGRPPAFVQSMFHLLLVGWLGWYFWRAFHSIARGTKGP